ncbi:MAG: tetratricopeptide repeat protein [Polyangiaceae bacterium]
MLSALVALPAFAASCGDEAPTPKVAPQPSMSGQTPTGTAPGTPQFGMADMPGGAGLSAAAAGPYNQGLNAFVNGDLPTARTGFAQAGQADPRCHQCFYSLGVVQERLKDAGAGGSYRQAYTIKSDYEPAIIAHGMFMARRNQLAEADAMLTQKRGQMPKSAAVTAALAEVKSLQKDTGNAQRLAQEALKLNPDYRPAMVIIARDHYRNRRLDLALYALQAVLDGFEPVAENPPRDKENPEALLLRGLIWREQGNRAGAMDQFKKAVQKRPDLVEARVQYANFLLEAGNAEEALPVLEGAVRFDADNVPAHLNLGDCYRLLGRWADAKREFEWVLAHDASLPQVHYDLGLMYLFAPSIPGMTAKQQIAEAQKSLKKFQELRKKDVPDDSDELLNRAKLKEGELTAGAAPAAPAAGKDGGAPANKDGGAAPPADAGTKG